MDTACHLLYNHFNHGLQGLEGRLLGSSGSWRSSSASLRFSNRRSWRLLAANRQTVVTANRRALVMANRRAVVTANRWAASRSSGSRFVTHFHSALTQAMPFVPSHRKPFVVEFPCDSLIPVGTRPYRTKEMWVLTQCCYVERFALHAAGLGFESILSAFL